MYNVYVHLHICLCLFLSLFLIPFIPHFIFHSLPSLNSSHQTLLIQNLSQIASSQLWLPMCFLSSLIHPFHVSLLCFHSLFPCLFPFHQLSNFPLFPPFIDSHSHPLLPFVFPSFTSLSSFDPFVQLFSFSLCSPHHYNVFSCSTVFNPYSLSTMGDTNRRLR